jgi:hypothetical protein
MKKKILQNPVNSGIFSMKNPLRRVKSYFPGKKLEKVRAPPPPKTNFLCVLKRKRNL